MPKEPSTPTDRSRLARFTSGAAPVLVVGSIVGGVIARFIAGTPMWLDEALTVNISAEPLSTIGERLKHDGHPPLFYWLLHGWMEIFGDGDTAIRALAGVFSVACLPLIWLVARRYTSAGASARATATSAVVLLAVMPFAVRYGSEARMYSLAMFLVLLGWWLLDRAREEPDTIRLVPLPFVAGLLLLTHYWAPFLLGAVGLGLLNDAFRGGEVQVRRAGRRCAVAIALGLVLYLPWLSTMLYQVDHTGTPWATALRPTALWSAGISVLGTGSPEGYLLGIVMVAAVALGVFGTRRDGAVVLVRSADRRTTEIALVVGVGMVAAAAASTASNSGFQVRYMAVFVPPLVVLAGIGLGRLPRSGRVVLLGIIVLLAAAANIYEWKQDRTQLADIAETIAPSAGPDDLVVVCPDQLGPSLERALAGRVELLAYPDPALDPRFVDWVDYLDRYEAVEPAEVVADLLATRRPGSAIWLVWESTYRIVGDECAEVTNELGTQTQSGEVLTAADSTSHFEFAALHRYVVP